MTAPLPQRLKMLSYRAWRRGIRETDLILGPFADAHLASLTADQLDAFEALLEQPDQELYD
jgi:antitoxin CptB